MRSVRFSVAIAVPDTLVDALTSGLDAGPEGPGWGEAIAEAAGRELDRLAKASLRPGEGRKEDKVVGSLLSPAQIVDRELRAAVDREDALRRIYGDYPS